MGITDSSLPELSTCVIGLTIMPMAMSMWFGSRTKSGFAVGSLFIIWYTIVIKQGVGIHNPLATYSGTDLTQGMKILDVVLLTLAIAFGFIGTLIGSVTDSCGLIPIYALLPGTAGIHNSYQRANNGSPLYPRTGLNRWGMFDLPRPYMAVAMNLVLFTITVIIPHVVFELFMDTNKTVAITVLLVVSFAGYVLTWFGNYFWPAPYLFGAHRRNIKDLGFRYHAKGQEMSDFSSSVKRDTAAANGRITRTVLVMAAFHVFGNLILGIVRYAEPDIDYNWIWATGVGGGAVILTVLIWGVMTYWLNDKENDAYETTPVLSEVPPSPEEEVVLSDDNNDDNTDSNGQQQGLSRRILNHFQKIAPSSHLHSHV